MPSRQTSTTTTHSSDLTYKDSSSTNNDNPNPPPPTTQSDDPFGLDIEVINNHRKSLSINSFSSLTDFKTTTNGGGGGGGHQPTPKVSSFTKRNSLLSSKRRASELYHNSMLQNSRSQQPDEFSIIDNSGESLNEQSLYKSLHMETREHEQLIEEYELRVRRKV